MYHSSINLFIHFNSPKIGYYCFLYLLFINSGLYAQQINEPVVCQNPFKELGNNYTTGGAFDINKYSCISDASPTAVHIATSPSGIEPNTAKYFFNFKDDSNLLQLNNNNSQTFTMPGKYWVLQQGSRGNQKLIACNTFEVIQTYQPDVEVNQCGSTDFSLTFPNTPQNQSHNQYNVNWGDGSSNTFNIDKDQLPFTTPAHIYTQNTQPKITVTAKYQRNGSVVCSVPPKTLNTNENKNAFISTLKTLNQGQTAELTIQNLQINYTYTIQYRKLNQTNWSEQMLPTNQFGSAQILINNLQPNTQYIYRLKIQPSFCPNSSYSEELKNLILTLKLQNSSTAIINWNQVMPTSKPNYTIYVQGTNGIPSIQSNSQEYQFHIPDCTKKYTFLVEASYNSNNQTIKVISDNVLLNPLQFDGQLPAITSVGILYSNNSIALSVGKPNTDVAKYLYYQTTNNTPKLIASQISNAIIDTNTNASQFQYCYQVQYQDVCGLKSQMSAPFCSILLTKKSPDEIQWSTISTTSTNVSYTLEIPDNLNFQEPLNNQTSINLNNISSIHHILLNQESTQLQITAQQQIPNPDTSTLIVDAISNPIQITLPPTCFYPNSFTPDSNGPAENEKFIVKAPFIKTFSIEIYNQWGEIVFASDNINHSWDGTFHGRACPAGSYAFKIILTNQFKQQVIKHGSLNLIR